MKTFVVKVALETGSLTGASNSSSLWHEGYFSYVLGHPVPSQSTAWINPSKYSITGYDKKGTNHTGLDQGEKSVINPVKIKSPVVMIKREMVLSKMEALAITTWALDLCTERVIHETRYNFSFQQFLATGIHPTEQYELHDIHSIDSMSKNIWGWITFGRRENWVL